MGYNERCECKSGIKKSNNYFSKGVEKLKKNPRYVFKVCFTLLCLGGCAWQTVSIVTLYFEYPTIVIIEKKQMETLRLPGVTLCNSNRVKKSKLAKYDPNFYKDWVEPDKDGHTFTQRLKNQELIDVSLRKMLKNMTVAQFRAIGFDFKDFVDKNFTKCASDIYNKDKPCKEIVNAITSVQDSGNCYTLFHKSRNTNMAKRAVTPGFANNPIERGQGDALNMEMSEEAMQPNEVIRLRVNFSKEEYVTLNEPVMGFIIVHDEKEVPIVRRRSFAISPGKFYLIYLTEEVRYYLPKPYATNCEYYTNEDEDKENIYSYLDNPLSETDCTIGCMAKKCMELCDCWPPEVPFIRNSSNDTDTKENQMKFCDWTEMKDNQKLIKVFQDKKNIVKSAFQFCFSEHQNLCGKQCKNNCVIKAYTFNREVRTWPSIERILHSRRSDEYWHLRNCCSIISIRYWNTMRAVHTYSPKINDIEFISYMGGLYSLWIGFSFLGFYEVIEKIYKSVIKQIQKSTQSDIDKHTDRVLTQPSRQNSKRYNKGFKSMKNYINQNPMSSKKPYFKYS